MTTGGAASAWCKALPEGMQAIQHDTVDLGDCVVCGTRGWAYPNQETPLSQEDERIFNREMIRLELALQSAVIPDQGLYRNAHAFVL